MSDEEERTAGGALFKIWEKQFRDSTRLTRLSRLPFPVTCGVDKLDAFATLARLTNSEGSCSLPSKSVRACRIVTNFWQFVDGYPRNIHSLSEISRTCFV